MQIARLSLFGVNEKCDVLRMPPRASLRPEDSPHARWLNVVFGQPAYRNPF